MAAGVALHRVLPLSIGAPASHLVGAALLVVGLSVTAAGVATVARHHTTILPHRRVSVLVTGGIYRFTRNPMYAGLALADVGGSFLVNSWWPLAFLVPALIVIDRLVIAPEERHLSDRFGARYDEYLRRVRRWL